MIRQPASENSFTVACPMPRDAPVSTIVRCSFGLLVSRYRSTWNGHCSAPSIAECDLGGSTTFMTGQHDLRRTYRCLTGQSCLLIAALQDLGHRRRCVLRH